jgi:integrase
LAFRRLRDPIWLTREQAKELLTVPDRSILKGKRDYVILVLLVGCALRRQELATLDVETIQLREGRWVLADFEGKGRRIRTVAIPVWVKQGINAWMTAAAIGDGRLLRSISKGGKVGKSLSDWAVWSVVEQSAKEIGIERFGAHDLRQPAPSSAERAAVTSSKSNLCLDTPPSRPPNAIWGRSRRSRSR